MQKDSSQTTRLTRPTLFGIVNITEDSFSDGGLFLDPDKAIQKGIDLASLDGGADVIDLGASSSHPDAKKVRPHEEIQRLQPVLHALQKKGYSISIDSFQKEVQSYAIVQKTDYINDINGFCDPSFYPILADCECKLIVMHSIQGVGIADRRDSDPISIALRIREFFEERIEQMNRAGISSNRLILDPGMGFFLGANPESSLYVLSQISELKKYFQLPFMVSVSRKSFLGNITGKDIKNRQFATLSAEIYAWLAGADYIRTHDTEALRDGLNVWLSIEAKQVSKC